MLITQWLAEGHTHLHFGAIRLILTLHGRKGLPVTVCLALLDTRYTKYEHDVIGTTLSTLHAGSVLLTIFSNFNIPLKDPNLSTCLKVQLQITGAEQVPSSYIATLHHQFIYRLQNHALDLPVSGHTPDTLLIIAERENEIPTIIQIPKQLS